jgi:lariat debranching enzyme
MGLLRNLQPTWWFAAHLHTRFEARVRHDPAPETTTSPSSRSGPPPRADNPDEITIDDDTTVEDSRLDAPSGSAMVPKVAESIAPPTVQNPDEITLDDEIEAVEPPPPPPPPPRETKFLALDKCLPHRQFLEASPPPSPRRELAYFVRPITIRSSISSRRSKSERQSSYATTRNG